jgi:glutaredoxin 3
MTNTIIWTKTDCPYCHVAKDMLASKNIEFEERIIGEGWTRDQLLESAPDAKTVPQIWLRGEYIGGCDDLEQYYEEHDMWRDD